MHMAVRKKIRKIWLPVELRLLKSVQNLLTVNHSIFNEIQRFLVHKTASFFWAEIYVKL